MLKSGLRILIRAPEVPFSVPPKTPKMGHFGCFGGYQKWTVSSAYMEFVSSKKIYSNFSLLSSSPDSLGAEVGSW